MPRRNNPDRIVGRWRIRFAAAALAAVVAAPSLAETTGLAPVEPQPDPARLEPGLSVKYHFGIFNSIEGMIMQTGGAATAEPGEPLARLDYQVDFGDVLTSKRQDGVGAFIKGLIRLDAPGIYVFRVQSNDGVQLDLGGETIFTEPEVHPDSMSDPLPVEIATPGWYAIEVIYFEKRNTSTLELYWKKPGETGEFALVPAEAFAHVPE